ncbi:MAG: gamma carbonic anhydrase family protein [Candidatus Eremiobacteraeota bacterium]|nr:gamma carbonic anhydrase family protein [Candidatus Eremiobacteraeota bacterium]
MALILPYKGKAPRIGAGAFVAPNATLIGDVFIGDGASVWFGAVLRADEAAIRIGARTSVQDNAVIHVYAGHDTIIEADVTIGHGAVLEACHVSSGALIGMNAVVLDRARVGAGSVIAAGAVVLEDQSIPADVLAAGVPAKVKKSLEGSSKHWAEIGAGAYVRLSAEYRTAGIGIVEELSAKR